MLSCITRLYSSCMKYFLSLVLFWSISVSIASAMQIHPLCQRAKELHHVPSVFNRFEARLERMGIVCGGYHDTIEPLSLFQRSGGTVIELITVEHLLYNRGVHLEDGWQPIAFTIDEQVEHFGVLLEHDKYGFRVYKNDQLLLEGQRHGLEEPAIFRFTNDGKLLHAVQGNQLYIDRTKLSESEDGFAFNRDDSSALYDGSAVTYAEESSVEYKEVKSGAALSFMHPSSEIQQIRRHAYDVYYSLKRGEKIYLYKNGERYTHRALAAPWGFLISNSGDVYYLTENEDSYNIYKNNELHLVKPNRAAFVLEDKHAQLWHVGYDMKNLEIAGAAFETKSLTLYRENMQMTDEELSNIEGAFAFKNDQFAVRAAPLQQPRPYFSWPPDWYLLKSGKLLGERFDYSIFHRDYVGLHFGSNSKVYFRNFDTEQERWLLYEDGEQILTEEISDVLHLRVEGDVVKVFTTRF